MPSTKPIALTHFSRTSQSGRVRSERGATLLELIIALAIMSGIMTGLYQLVDTFNQNTKSAVVSQHMSTVGQAAQAYIKDNYAAVAALATAGTPALIRVSTLTSTNYLQSGFNTSNAYNQNVCVLVLQPAANQLAALVVAEGGTTIDDLTLGQIAATMGASGGGVYSTAATTLKGAMGGWSTAVGNFANANNLGLKCDGTAGDVTIAAGHPIQALWFANGDVTAGFLYRNSVPGRPELNQMQTALDMNNNPITNVATLALTTAVVQGAACTAGVVARDANGAVMSCQGGTYQPQGSAYWKDPVGSFGALPACNAASAWQTRIAQTPAVGIGPRAYTCSGGTWRPLALDKDGSITIAGTATINNLAGNLTVTPVAVAGAACAPNGRIAQDGVGGLLSCKNSVWATIGGGIGEGQTWQPISIINGTANTNSTSKPIQVAVGAYGALNGYLYCYVQNSDASAWVLAGAHYGSNSGGDNDTHYWTASFIVPPGLQYYCTWNYWFWFASALQ